MEGDDDIRIKLPTITLPVGRARRFLRRLPTGPRSWLPSRGNVLFTLLTVIALLGLNRAGALSLAAPAAAPQASTNTIAYQGRIASAGGTPLTGTYSMVFRLYNIAAGGVPLWEETWTGANGVKVSDGLFNVMLGSLTPIPTSIVSANPSLWLGITVGTDSEMLPRVQLGSVPFSMQALTVPDASVTTTKIADGAVTAEKLAAGIQMTQTRAFTPAVYTDRASSPEVSEGLHRWPSGIDSAFNYAFQVPSDYVSGGLTVRQMFYEHDTGGTGLAKMDRSIRVFSKIDGSIVSALDVNADHAFGTLRRTYSIAQGSFNAGDLISVRELRHGGDAGDTAGRMDVMAIGIEYVGR